MTFKIEGLPVNQYQHLFGLSDTELAAHGAKRYVCDETPGFPDRIEMRDAEVGETLLLLNHVNMELDTPYKATHAIFVREGASETYQSKNTIPPVMYNRVISLRAFDEQGMMLDANIATGEEIKATVMKLFKNPDVKFINAHNAVRGCFSGRISRTE